MNGIFGNLFDLNRDGKLDAFEHAVEFSILDDMLRKDGTEDDIDQLDDLDGDDE